MTTEGFSDGLESPAFINDEDTAPLVVYMENPEDMRNPWIVNPYFTCILVVYTVTCLFGVIGNMFVVGVTAAEGFKSSKDSKTTNMFLISLMISDFLMILAVAPLRVAGYFLVDSDQGGYTCKASSFIKTLAAAASVLNLPAVSVERYEPTYSSFINSCCFYNFIFVL